MDAEKAFDPVLGNNYNTRLDHPILNHYGFFYPEALYNDIEALYNDLIFKLTLASALQVVKGSGASKLVYKLTNIQLKYETWQPPCTTAARPSHRIISCEKR